MPMSVKEAYNWYQRRERELQNTADNNGGRLPKHEWWRQLYYREPYLLLESNDVILERFGDVLSNSVDITANAQIAPTPMMENDGRLSRLFTELIEETNWRGILTKDSMGVAGEQLSAYFDGGEPVGVRMFRGALDVRDDWLFKFSKTEFVADMHRYGQFRVSPASFYARGSHLRAMKDLETRRPYRMKAIHEALNGTTSIDFEGNRLPIVGGVVPLEFIMGDYYLFSTCNRLSRRMPTDFEVDAVLVIKEKAEFIRRFRQALLEQRPTWEFLEGNVYYYDPYNDIPKDRNQEFFKHVSYAYQREHRCVLRPKGKIPDNVSLEPFFIEIGRLDDIAEMINAPRPALPQ
jgi:hypothetical protein